MNIFDLHAAVLADYRDFVRSFLLIADERARQFVADALEKEARLWPDFLVQVSPSYATGHTVKELAQQGQITADTAAVFQKPDGKPFTLIVTRKRPFLRPHEQSAPGRGRLRLAVLWTSLPG
jgi:hypothetical protein